MARRGECPLFDPRSTSHGAKRTARPPAIKSRVISLLWLRYITVIPSREKKGFWVSFFSGSHSLLDPLSCRDVVNGPILRDKLAAIWYGERGQIYITVCSSKSKRLYRNSESFLRVFVSRKTIWGSKNSLTYVIPPSEINGIVALLVFHSVHSLSDSN